MERKEKGIKTPLKVEFAFTGKCNLRCRHCCTAGTWEVEKGHELSTSEIKEVLKYLSEIGIFEIFLYGGEPFFHPDICELLDEASKYKFKFTTSTNGTLMSEELARYLKGLNIFTSIQVSLDGQNAEVHDALRGEGTFEKTVGGIKNLISVGIPVEIRASISKINYMYIREIADYVESEFRVKHLGFGEMLFGGAACKNDCQLSITPAERCIAMKRLKELMREKQTMSFSASFVQIAEMFDAYINSPPQSGKRGKFGKCGITTRVVGLRSDGEIVPCSAFWDYSLGNIKKDNLLWAWKESEAIKMFHQLAEKTLDYYEKCKACDYLTFCNGGCRAAAYYDTGKVDGVAKAICDTFGGKKKDVIERFLAAKAE